MLSVFYKTFSEGLMSWKGTSNPVQTLPASPTPNLYIHRGDFPIMVVASYNIFNKGLTLNLNKSKVPMARFLVTVMRELFIFSSSEHLGTVIHN